MSKLKLYDVSEAWSASVIRRWGRQTEPASITVKERRIVLLLLQAHGMASNIPFILGIVFKITLYDNGWTFRLLHERQLTVPTQNASEITIHCIIYWIHWNTHREFNRSSFVIQAFGILTSLFPCTPVQAYILSNDNAQIDVQRHLPPTTCININPEPISLYTAHFT